MNVIKSIFSFTIIFLLSFTFVLADVGSDFRNRNGNEWVIGSYPWGYINLATRSRPEDIGPNITNTEAIEIAEEFMSRNLDLFGIESLTFYNTYEEGVGGNRSWVVEFIGDAYEDLPVTKLDMMILMTLDGKIFGVGDVEVCTTVFQDILQGYYPIPQVSENEAINSAQESTGIGDKPIETNLEYVPSNETGIFDYKLAWEVTFNNKKVIVDAESGNVLSIESTKEKFNLKFFEHDIFIIIVIVVILIGIYLFRRRRISNINNLKIIPTVNND